MRIAAYRAMRRAGMDILPVAARLARDADPGVRREVALSMRDQPAAASLGILADVARGFDGQDRSYLEALGTGATGKEAALYDRLVRQPGVPSDPVAWPQTVGWMAWRLHPPTAVTALAARARSAKLSIADRRLATDALAFVDDRAAADAMFKIALDKKEPLSELSTWWLLNRMSNNWKDYNLDAAMKRSGLYDPDTIAITEMVVPKPAAAEISIEEVLKVPGDAARGKNVVAACVMCHAVGGVGAEVGPALDGWGRGKSAEVIARAIVQPNAEIAQGYDATELRTTDGMRIQGLLIKQGDPLMMRSQGGVTQLIPAKRVGARQRMTESLMPSAAQLGLTAQNVADLVAFLTVK
jgi:putative heme-binding domain-containing protein